MISPETIAIIQTIIYLAGIGGVVYWGRKWYLALQGAVAAQKTTIDAQKAFMESMAMFLNIADAPKMSERYEAYRKLVDHEKEVILKRFSEEKKEFLERLDDSDVGITNLLAVVRGMTPYVPHRSAHGSDHAMYEYV
jgi:hypothetical protein